MAIASYTNTYAYSDDGINWTLGTMPSIQFWQSICYGNGRFVAIASSSNIAAYSDDGIVWTEIELKKNSIIDSEGNDITNILKSILGIV